MSILHDIPLEEFDALQKCVNPAFEEFLLGIKCDCLSNSRWNPAVDVYETDDMMFLCAELPGLASDDMEVRIYGSSLILKGNRCFSREGRHKNYHRIERTYGTFERYFKIPDSIDVRRISAICKDGVLTVTLPKVEEPPFREIHILFEESR